MAYVHDSKIAELVPNIIPIDRLKAKNVKSMLKLGEQKELNLTTILFSQIL